MTDIKQANLLEYLRHIRKSALTKEAKETLVKTVKETVWCQIVPTIAVTRRNPTNRARSNDGI